MRLDYQILLKVPPPLTLLTGSAPVLYKFYDFKSKLYFSKEVSKR